MTLRKKDKTDPDSLDLSECIERAEIRGYNQALDDVKERLEKALGDTDVWRCDNCGSYDNWFDRTITYDDEGNQDGMHTRCSDCGMADDELDITFIEKEVSTLITELSGEPQDEPEKG